MKLLHISLPFLLAGALAACSDDPEAARRKLAERQVAPTPDALLAKTKDAKRGEGDAKLLVEAGVDPNARQANGMTVLMSAAFNGQHATARALLDRGADVNATAKGFTALRLAVERNDEAMVRLLLERGAHPDLRADGAPSALDKAREGSNPALVGLLEAKMGR